jgi:hypothetical protein
MITKHPFALRIRVGARPSKKYTFATLADLYTAAYWAEQDHGAVCFGYDRKTHALVYDTARAK